MMIDNSVIEKEAAFAEEMKKRALRAEGQLGELQEAARAFLDAFATQAARCAICEEEGKREPVMLRKGLYMACDAHGRELLEAPEDFSYAPALRRLRALLSAAAAPPCPACGRHDAPRGQRCAFCAQLGDDLPAG